MLPIKYMLSCLCTYTLTSVFAPEHLSAADIYARTADSSGEHDGRTTPVDNTEEPANSVDTDPGETVTAEQPVDSPRETVTAEQPVDSPRETVTAEQAVDSPREMVTAEQPVDSPRETVTAEQAVDSPRETVTAEQAVGDSVHNEDTDKKSESLASDVENADTTEEINEDGLDMEENGDDGTHDAEPVTYIPEDAEEHGDEPDCGHHEEDKVTDVAVDQGRFGWTCVVLYTRWKPHPSMGVCLLLSACNPNLPA